MSVLSDDTDFLLLIPPDFFSIPSDTDEDARKKFSEKLVVSDLISQVNDLEGRICMIENKCVDENIMTCNGNLRQLRHFGSADTLNVPYKANLNSRSLQATPLKNCPIFSPSLSLRTSELSLVNSSDKRTNCLFEPRQNLLTSNEYINQKEKDAQLLKEIDSFFKLKQNQCADMNDKEKCLLHDSGKPVSLDSSELSNAVFSLKKVNELLMQLDETQKEIEQKLKLKELEEIEAENVLTYEKFQSDAEPFPDLVSKVDSIVPEEKLKILEEDLSENLKVETRNPRRSLKFDEFSPRKNECAEKKESFPGSNALHPKVSNMEFHCGSDDFRSNAICNNSKPLSVNTEEKNDAEKILDIKRNQNPSKDLLSLSNLWGSTANMYKTTAYEDQQILKQRLQEERCRRQHCEELIQQLQLRLLEEQQKIAVAVKVDKEKDQAISRLNEGWNKLVGHWKDLEGQRNHLAKKLLSDREMFKKEMAVACQTVKRYELELSKALDLAHGYKEKCESADKEKKAFKGNMTKEVEVMKLELRSAKEKVHSHQEKNEKLEKQLSNKEESLNQSKAKISELQSQIREMKKLFKDLQAETEALKHEREKLNEKLKDERSKVSTLENGKKNLQQLNDDLKRKEKSLKDDLKVLTEQMEKTKVELKDFYQKQVEKIVQEKLQEFQEQLTTAEKVLRNEIESREKAVTDLAVKQVQQIVEKHVEEINILEEKHKEELELCRLHVAQREEKLMELERKLEYHSSHKTEIAQKLHSVMETQWQEALKIITASSPLHNKGCKDNGKCDSDRESILTRQKTFTMAPAYWGEASSNVNGSGDSSSATTTTDTPFSKDGQLTCREHLKKSGALTYRIDETPQKMGPVTQDNLKKYIEVLLERAPGRPFEDSETFESTLYKNFTGFSDDSSALPHWQHVLTEASSSHFNEFSHQSETSKSAKEGKAPWK